ncbi:MAG: manganese efflux pump [Heliobacteriaceae bacterium]|nr:manganese efflux pump [Heliobacteriaceae bacterium]
MNLFEIILLAIALGIDCFVAAFSHGIIFEKNRIKNSVMLAMTMGLFQGLMPVFGCGGAAVLYKYINNFSHWLVFAIFFLLGLKFIFEAFLQKEHGISCIDFKCLIGMGIATSIDAFAAGVSIGLSNRAILIPAIIIGFVSFIMSLCGFWSGNCLRKFPSRHLEILGGLILIGLAVKSLYQ